MLKEGVVLFFDINGTIIALDQAQDKSGEAKILQELAKKYQLRHYAGTKNVSSLREFASQRRHLDKGHHYNYLLDYLDFLSHPQAQLIKDEYNYLHKLVTSQSGHIFKSFFKLIQWLELQGVPYTLILRSFGSDIPIVVKELAEQGIVVEQQGVFVGNSLQLESQLLDSPIKIMEQVKFGRHAAWRDDYAYWHTHHQRRSFAKPFFVDARWPLTLFFDDNALEKEIISPLNAQGVLMDHALMVKQGKIMSVNMLAAIADENYFIEHLLRFVK